MADLKITDLGAALSVGDSNVTVLDDGSNTMKVTMSQLKTYSIGSSDISGIGNGTVTGAISSVNTSKNAIKDSIAPTESGTASRAYSTGEKLYIGDVLYKATTDIASGAALVAGTNITPASDVSTEILDLADVTKQAILDTKNIIAPVENGGTAILAYSAGDQFIRNDALCKALIDIQAADPLVLNTNYADAGQVGDQINSVKQALSDEVSARSEVGAHNLFNINDNVSRSDATIANNGFTNYTAIADTTFRFQLWARNSADSTIGTLVDTNISSTGKKSFNITIPSGTVMLVIAHFNTSLISIKNNVNLEAGNYIISFDVNGYNPSTVGGLDVRNIMIRKATDANADFEPYAMTNQQLTENSIRVFDITATTSASGNIAINNSDLRGNIPIMAYLTGSVSSQGLYICSIVRYSGGFYVNVKDTSGNVLANTQVDLVIVAYRNGN